MDDTFYDLALQAMAYGIAGQSMTGSAAHQRTLVAASSGFARTEEISNVAFAGSLYGLLSLMKAPAATAAAPVTRHERREEAALTQLTFAQPLAVT